MRGFRQEVMSLGLRNRCRAASRQHHRETITTGARLLLLLTQSCYGHHHPEQIVRSTIRGNKKKNIQSCHNHRYRELLADTKDCTHLPRLSPSGTITVATNHDYTAVHFGEPLIVSASMLLKENSKRLERSFEASGGELRFRVRVHSASLRYTRIDCFRVFVTDRSGYSITAAALLLLIG